MRMRIMLRFLALTMVAIVGFTMMACTHRSGAIAPNLSSTGSVIPEVKWTFESVTSYADDHDNPSLRDKYKLELSSDVDNEQLVSTAIQFFELGYLLRNFDDVETQYDLRGKSFTSDKTSGEAAVQDLLQTLIHSQNHWSVDHPNYSGIVHPNDPKVWTFSKVKQDPKDKKSPIDPDALYIYTLTTNYGGRSYHIKYSDLEFLLAHFEVENPNDPNELEDITFNGPNVYPEMYVDHFITVQKQGDKHRPTTNEEIYDQLAIYLSKGAKSLRFPDVEKYYLFKAFIRFFQDDYPLEIFTEKLRNRVSELSNGKVTISRFKGSPFHSENTLREEYGLLFVLTKDSKNLLFYIDRQSFKKEPFISLY